ELKQKRDEVWKLLCGEQYEKLEKEFNRQVDTLVNKGFPVLTNRKEHEFREIFTPLRKHLRQLSREKFPEGHIPFIIVPSEKLLSLEKKIPLMEVEGKRGAIDRDFLDLPELKTIDGLKILRLMAYLIIDIENGKTMLGKSADEAVNQFKIEGRSPLTVEEGVALVFYYPEILKDHNIDLPSSCFSDDKFAYLWLSMNKLELSWGRAKNSSKRWGSASCSRRI
ncbi:MAG: hypothetical protein HYW78_02110, partial [Parcubacteria group bacterium]|nr:hypothetical protein [Parcubacteria group bacterium]